MAQRRMSELLRVGPGPVDLAAIDPRGTPGLPTQAARSRDLKQWARDHLAELGGELFAEQEKLFAAAKGGGSRQRLLMVLQAMDCGGKDGTIKRVVGEFNPQGVHIVSFGAPTEQELAHDFLWRIERQLPAPGLVGVFNRSHYEDVLVVRVHELVPPAVWKARYEQINQFERILSENGVRIVKIFLHISKAEQKRRLQQRLDNPEKNWKFSEADLAERKLWGDYMAAYEDAINRCSTDVAPWYVVPANVKWARDAMVGRLLRDTMDSMSLRRPKVSRKIAKQKIR